jgi:hypothetical protein
MQGFSIFQISSQMILAPSYTMMRLLENGIYHLTPFQKQNTATSFWGLEDTTARLIVLKTYILLTPAQNYHFWWGEITK